jgi:hypothetical protein
MQLQRENEQLCVTSSFADELSEQKDRLNAENQQLQATLLQLQTTLQAKAETF